MTNIEKVKRILDAGHCVKVKYNDSAYGLFTITSYIDDKFSYIRWLDGEVWFAQQGLDDCTIEVIQRIPTPYKAGDKVLVLSNPSPDCIYSKWIDIMVWKILTIKSTDSFKYCVYNEDTSDYFYFPAHCLAPAFDEEPNLSWKEVTVTIDGKEYSATLKLI